MFTRSTPCQNPSKCGVTSHPKGSPTAQKCLTREPVKVAKLPSKRGQ